MNNAAATIRFNRKKFERNLPRTTALVAKAAEAFFRDSFRKQGKQDVTLTPWKPRSFEFPGKSRALLVKRGGLERSIKRTHSKRRARISSNLPYSALQNEGGRIRITPKMRRFFWAMYYKESGRIKLRKDGSARKTKSNSAITKSAEIWRNLALTTKKEFIVPKRPFIYHSRDLNDKIDRLIDHLVFSSMK